jgi:NADH-quinone oxidoreductase subunit C
VDKNTLVVRLNKIAEGSVLDVRRFGRSDIHSVWIDTQFLSTLAFGLKKDPQLKLDWLENLSVVELDEALMISYFIRSTVTQHSLLMRALVTPPSPDAEVKFPSVCGVWPMAEPHESEASELFGIQFEDPSDSISRGIKHNFLPEGWKGFPLRKSYKFPTEFYGITHYRPFNTLKQDKKLPR